MNNIDLLINPYWEKKDLGKAIPPGQHALSVALPRWEDVIAYEEKEEQCIKALNSIYPRFGFNSLIKEISKKALIECGNLEWTAWPYPNLICARKAKAFCERKSNNCSTMILEILGLQCLLTDQSASIFAQSFWQHTGLGASSRQAEIALNKAPSPSKEDGDDAINIVEERLSKLYGCDKRFISLYPSGMAALTIGLEIVNKISPNRPTVQIGFPYVDVLKLPQVIFNGGVLLQDKNLKTIASELDKHKPSALIVEVPSNPTLECIDLVNISNLAHERGIVVIVDDTIGSPMNIELTPYADLIFSSLTKSFAGRGDIMAGSLLISPFSKWSKTFEEVISNTKISKLYAADAIELAQASNDIHERLPKLNQACLMLKHRLEKHPTIKEVFHPEYCPNFKKLMKCNDGYGCLLSFKLVEGLEKSKKVYNALKVCKGPSFGTKFTLVSPYMLLAHYKELDWAERCGIPPHLLRVSVGLEKDEILWERFKEALIA